jgi:hypothetical protein
MLCASISYEDLTNQKYLVVLACGEFHRSFPKSTSVVHLANCGICNKAAETEFWPKSIVEQCITEYEASAYTSLANQMGDLYEKYASKHNPFRVWSRLRSYKLQPLKDTISHLEEAVLAGKSLLEKHEHQAIQMDREKKRISTLFNLLPFTQCQKGGTNDLFFCRIEKSERVVYNFAIPNDGVERIPANSVTIPAESTFLHAPFLVEIVTNRYVSCVLYNLDEISWRDWQYTISWRFIDPADNSVQRWMAFEVDSILWLNLVRCVEQCISKLVQDTSSLCLKPLLPTSQIETVAQFLDFTTAEHVFLFIMQLLEPLRQRKDALFDPRSHTRIRLFSPQVKNNSSEDFYSELGDQFIDKASVEEHNELCTDVMQQFVKQHLF